MMTQASPITRADAGAAARSRSGQQLTFPRVLRGEWIKLTTLRSTWWSIGTVAAVTIGTALLLASAADAAAFDAIQAVTLPIPFTVLFAGILGAISATGEYSTGMIRSTLAANPRRGSMLGAKILVTSLFMFLASLVMLVAAAIIASVIMSPRGMGIDWSDPAASIAPLVVAALAMSVCTVIGVAFGFVIRSGAGAIAATVGLLFVLPIVTSLFTFAGDALRPLVEAAQYLPVAAAQSAIASAAAPQDAAGSFVALGCWVAGGMLLAWGVLRSRDA